MEGLLSRWELLQTNHRMVSRGEATLGTWMRKDQKEKQSNSLGEGTERERENSCGGEGGG